MGEGRDVNYENIETTGSFILTNSDTQDKSELQKLPDHTSLNDILHCLSLSFPPLEVGTYNVIESRPDYFGFYVKTVDDISQLVLKVPKTTSNSLGIINVQQILERSVADSIGSGGEDYTIQYAKGAGISGVSGVRVDIIDNGINASYFGNVRSGDGYSTNRYIPGQIDLRISTASLGDGSTYDYELNYFHFSHASKQITYGETLNVDHNFSCSYNTSFIHFSNKDSQNTKWMHEQPHLSSYISHKQEDPAIYSSNINSINSNDIYPFDQRGHLIAEIGMNKSFLVATHREDVYGDNTVDKCVKTFVVKNDGISLYNYKETEGRDVEEYKDVGVNFNDNSNIISQYNSNINTLKLTSNIVDINTTHKLVVNHLDIINTDDDINIVGNKTLNISSNDITFDGNINFNDNNLKINSDGNIGIGTSLGVVNEELHISKKTLFDSEVKFTNAVNISGDAVFGNLTVTGETIHKHVVSINDLILEDRQFLLANTTPLVAKSDANLQGSGLKILTTDGNVSIEYQHDGTLYYDGSNEIKGPAWQFSENIALPSHGRIHTNILQSSNIDEPLQYLGYDGKGLFVVQKEGHIGYGNLGVNNPAPDKLLYAKETSNSVHVDACARFAHGAPNGSASLELMIDDDANKSNTGGKIKYDGSDNSLRIGYIKNGVFIDGIGINGLGDLIIPSGINKSSTEAGTIRYNPNDKLVEFSRDSKWHPIGPDVNLLDVRNETSESSDDSVLFDYAIKIVNNYTTDEDKLTITFQDPNTLGAYINLELKSLESKKFLEETKTTTYTFSTPPGGINFRVKKFNILTGVTQWYYNPISLPPTVPKDVITIYNDYQNDTSIIYVSSFDGGDLKNVHVHDEDTLSNIKDVYISTNTTDLNTKIGDTFYDKSEPFVSTNHVLFSSNDKTFTVPQGVNSIKVVSIGAGGSGNVSSGGGGGGGGGSIVMTSISVIPGDVLSVACGTSLGDRNSVLYKNGTILSATQANGGFDGTETNGGSGGCDGGSGGLAGSSTDGNSHTTLDTSFLSSIQIKYGRFGRKSLDSGVLPNEGGGGGASGVIIGYDDEILTTQIPGSAESGTGYGAGGGGSTSELNHGNDGIICIEYEVKQIYKTDYMIYNDTTLTGANVPKLTIPYGTKDIKIVSVGGGSHGNVGLNSCQSYNHITINENDQNWLSEYDLNIEVGRGGKLYDKNGTDSKIYGNGIDITTNGANVDNSSYVSNMNTVSLNSIATEINDFQLVDGSVFDYNSHRPEFKYGKSSGKGLRLSNRSRYQPKIDISGHEILSAHGSHGASGGLLLKDYFIPGSNRSFDTNFRTYGITSDGFIVESLGDVETIATNTTLDDNGVPLQFPPNITDYPTQDILFTHSVVVDDIGNWTINIPEKTRNIRYIATNPLDSSNIIIKSVNIPNDISNHNISISLDSSTIGTVSSSDSGLVFTISTSASDISSNGFVYNTFMENHELSVDSNNKILLDGKEFLGKIYIEWDVETQDEMIKLKDKNGVSGLVYIEYTHLVPFITNSVSSETSKLVINYGTGIIAKKDNPITLTEHIPGVGQYKTINPIPNNISYYYYKTGSEYSIRNPTMGFQSDDITFNIEVGSFPILFYNNGGNAIDKNTYLHIQGGSKQVYTSGGNVNISVGDNDDIRVIIQVIGGANVIKRVHEFNELTYENETSGDHAMDIAMTSSDTLYYYTINDGSTITRYPTLSGYLNTDTLGITLSSGDIINIYNKGHKTTDLLFNDEHKGLIDSSGNNLYIDAEPDVYFDVYVNNKKYNTYSSNVYIPLQTYDMYVVKNLGKINTTTASSNIIMNELNQLVLSSDNIKYDSRSITVGMNSNINTGWGIINQSLQSQLSQNSIDAHITGTYHGEANKFFEIKFVIDDIFNEYVRFTWEYIDDTTETALTDQIVCKLNSETHVIYGIYLKLPVSIPSAATNSQYYSHVDKIENEINTDNTSLTIKNSTHSPSIRYSYDDDVHTIDAQNYITIGDLIQVDVSEFTSNTQVIFTIQQVSNATNDIRISRTSNGITNNHTQTNVKTQSTSWHNLGFSTRFKFITGKNISDVSNPLTFTVYPFENKDSNKSFVLLDSSASEVVSVDNTTLNISVNQRDIWEYYHDVDETGSASDQTQFNGGIECRGYYNGSGSNVHYEIYISANGTFYYKILRDNVYETKYTEWDNSSSTDGSEGSNYIKSSNTWIQLKYGIEIRFTDNLVTDYTHSVGNNDHDYLITLCNKQRHQNPFVISKINHGKLLALAADGKLTISSDMPSTSLTNNAFAKKSIYKNVYKPNNKNVSLVLTHHNTNTRPINMDIKCIYYNNDCTNLEYFTINSKYTASLTNVSEIGMTNTMSANSIVDTPVSSSNNNVYGITLQLNASDEEVGEFSFDIEYTGPDDVNIEFVLNTINSGIP